MRSLLLSIALAMIATAAASAQATPYSKAPPAAGAAPGSDSAHIPDFMIALADGKHLTRADLDKSKPVMIVYYSPTCDHCQHFGQDLAAHIGEFKGVQIVMVTFRPLNEVQDFIRITHLTGSGALIGSEGLRWTVQHHYNITTFPFVAAYDRHWKLRGVFRYPPVDLSTLRRDLLGHEK
ncbi:MAG TPA: redoxin domain-containing protein [Dinghuibacter sp.]|uniref:peroxiredoxin family protein n=1 Tax=Dinghuibacter sp. TaxID=2024697 RepID=UPI002B5F2867|nr:redoxin domain-containing protein [Dinghuibacter sp.]HTJ12867.1 redoxin domain-containing protein [Dinghuibacter sp.]